jgi:hypothetical protein
MEGVGSWLRVRRAHAFAVVIGMLAGPTLGSNAADPPFGASNSGYSIKIFVGDHDGDDELICNGNQPVATLPISSECTKLYTEMSLGLYAKLGTAASTPNDAAYAWLEVPDVDIEVYGPVATGCTGKPLFGPASNPSGIRCSECVDIHGDKTDLAFQVTCPLFDAWGMCEQRGIQPGGLCELACAMAAFFGLLVLSPCAPKPYSHLMRALACFIFLGLSVVLGLPMWLAGASGLFGLMSVCAYCKYKSPADRRALEQEQLLLESRETLQQLQQQLQQQQVQRAATRRV